MFETAEIGRKVPKDEYEQQVPALRSELLRAQFALQKTNAATIVVISGVDGAGKSETVNRLTEWLDVRGVEVHAFGPLSDEEEARPEYWKFWRTLPSRGRIGIYFGSWYTAPIIDRVWGRARDGRFQQMLSRIVHFERALVDDGALIVKFWLHLTKRQQKRRFEKLEADAETRWRVTRDDWRNHRRYDDFTHVAESAIRTTDTGPAPWFLVEAEDARYRELTVARTLLEGMNRRLAQVQTDGRAHGPAADVKAQLPARASRKRGTTAAADAPKPAQTPPAPAAASLTILDKLDLTQALREPKYRRDLERCQRELGRLA